MSMKPRAFVYLLLITTLACGCSEDTEVRSYKVAKRPVERPAESTPAQTIGVIYPNMNTAWFLKLMDAPEKVESLASEFRQLANSVKFDGSGQPEWAQLDGWKDERPQQVTGFEAFAKFTHSSGVSATLTKLGANTTNVTEWQGYVTSNINRWRDQLSLAPQDWPTMVADLEEFPNHAAGEVKAYFVNLKGMRKGSGGMGGAPFLERMRAQQAQQQGQPQTASASPETGTPSVPANPPARLQLKYQAPDGWQEMPASGIRLASFQIQQQEQAATVSISTSTGQVPAAVEMWLQQLGQKPDPGQVEQIIKTSTEGTTNNISYRCYQLQSDESQTAIRVVVIPVNSSENLYVKMTGAKSLVESQSPNMDKFVGSLTWQ